MVLYLMEEHQVQMSVLFWGFFVLFCFSRRLHDHKKLKKTLLASAAAIKAICQISKVEV